MTIYIVLIILIILINLIIGQENKKRKKLSVVLTFLLIFLIQALRDKTVGVDLLPYENFFNIISRHTIKENITNNYVSLEIGYIIFNNLILLFTKDFQWFIIITSFIINAIMAWFIYKYSKNVLSTILLYIGLGLFIFSFSGIRQMLAISVCLIAFDFLRKRKYIPWLVCIVIAFSFHKSALVMILSLPLSFIKIKPKHLSIILPIMAIISIWGKSVAIFVVQRFLPSYSEYISGSSTFGMLGIFLAITYCLCLVASYRDEDNNIVHLVRNLALAAAFMQLFGNISPVTGRITFYFVPFLSILIPYSVSKVSSDKKTRDIINLIYCSFTLFALFVPSMLSGYLNLVPYKFFWQ